MSYQRVWRDKVPRDVEVLGELPRYATGELVRRRLDRGLLPESH